MAETRSVRFSPILEQTYDETSEVCSDVVSFSPGMSVEKAYFASLSLSGKSESGTRAPSKRKIALLALGFILLLGIGGAAIYLITREIYNREGKAYSVKLGSQNLGFPLENSTVKIHTSPQVTTGIIRPSSETINLLRTTSFPPKQTRLITTTAVYETSVVITDFRSRRQNATYTSNVSESSPEASSAWLIQKRPSVFPDMTTATAATPYWSETDVFIHKTNAGPSKTFSKSGAFPTQSSFTGPLQSTFGSSWFFDDRQADTSISLNLEEISISTLPPLSTLSVKVHLATSILNDTGTAIKSSTYRLSPSGNAESKWTEIKYSESTSASFQHTTKQSTHTQFVQTTLSSFAASSHYRSQFVSKNSALIQTKVVSLKANTMNISHRLSITKSVNFSFLGVNLDSTLVSTPLMEVLKTASNSEREWPTSRPSLSSDVATNNNHDTLPSNKTSLSAGYRWTTSTVMLQISSYRLHTRVDSLQLSWSSTASPKHSWVEAVITQSGMASPVPSVSRLSKSTLVILPDNPYSNINYGISRSTVNFSSSFSSSLKGQSNTFEGKEKSIAFRGSQGVSSTLHTTYNIPTTSASRRDSSSSIGLKLTSKASSDVYTSLSVVPQTNPLTTQTLLPSYFSTLRDKPPAGTSLKTFSSLPMKSQPIPKAVPSWSTKSVFETNPILSKKLSIYIWFSSSPSVFANVPISSSSSNNTFRSTPTFATKVTSRKTDTSSRSHVPVLSTVSYSSSVQASASKQWLTFKTTSFFLTVGKTSTSILDNPGFPLGTSSFQYMKSTESVEQRLPLVLTKNLHVEPTLSFQIGTTDTSKYSTSLYPAVISPPSSSSKRFSAVEMTSWKPNSQTLNVGKPNVTYSFQHLGSSKDHSNQDRPTKVPSVVTATLLHKRCAFTSSNVTRTSVLKVSTTVNSTALYQSLLAFTSSLSVMMKDNTTLNGSLRATLSAQPTGKSTFAYTYTSFSQTVRSGNIFPYHFTSVSTKSTPTSSMMPNSSTPYKVLDGSFIIRNMNYHANLSNPNTVMFKTLAGEVEAIINNILSLNTTDVLDVEVTSFRNGSVIADFYLRVRYNSSLNDQKYAQLLSEANRTLWRGFYVTNITVTLRTTTLEGSSEPLKGSGPSLSKTVIIATLTVLGALLIAVAAFAGYYCKKKGVCNTSQVKPADSPFSPSELDKIQPVRRDPWVANDEPFLSLDVPTDPNQKSNAFYETLSLRVMNRNDTDPDESHDQDSMQESMTTPFEPDYTNNDALNKSALENANPSD